MVDRLSVGYNRSRRVGWVSCLPSLIFRVGRPQTGGLGQGLDHLLQRRVLVQPVLQLGQYGAHIGGFAVYGLTVDHPGALALFIDQSRISVSYTHLRAHETDSYLVCRL